MSLYFNNRTLVDNRSNFRQAIANYIRTNNQAYLKKAVNELIYRSNPSEHQGIQNRRDAEGELLASFKSPTYTKPNQPSDSKKVTIAQIGKTIIPLNNGVNNGGNNIANKNSDYFIWRTSMDHKVRQEHVILEGKIFRKDNPPTYLPGTMHNCRCSTENVPDYIVVNDPEAISKAFDLYLRKGITDPLLMLSGLDCR